MSAYTLSGAARLDLIDIVEFVAADNLNAAYRLRDRMFVAFDRLADQPGLGHVRDDLIGRDVGVRFWPVDSYLVIYRQAAGEVQIVRVLSGYRDIAAILSDNPG